MLSGSFTVDGLNGVGVSMVVNHPTEGAFFSDAVFINVLDNAFGGTTDAIVVQGTNLTGALGGIVPGLGSMTVDLRGDASVFSGTSVPTDLATWNAFTGRILGLPAPSNPDATTGIANVATFASLQNSSFGAVGAFAEGGDRGGIFRRCCGKQHQ